MCNKNNNNNNNCSDCNPCNPCKCENRYQGPDIPQVGITTGMTYDEVLEVLSNYTSDVNFEDGVGIESEGYNPLTGVLTLNFTDGTSYSTGDLRGQQGPAGSNGLDGIPGPNQLLIENTLIVSKNGNDSTGVRNDWAKPFLTITGANAAAQPSDLIIVYPGTYSESNVVLSNISYYFYKGAIVNSATNCISDTLGVPKNIMVYGEGDFISASGRAIITSDPATNVIFNFNYAQGFDGILIQNADNINIKGKHVVGKNQYTVSLRGNATGYVDIDFYDGTQSANKGQTLFFRNACLDSVERTVYVKGKKLLSNCEFAQGAITTENCEYLRMIIDIDDVLHSSANPTLDVGAVWHQSGKMKLNSNINSDANYGIILGSNGEDVVLLVEDSQIYSNNSALYIVNGSSNVYAEINNSDLSKIDDSINPTVNIGTTSGTVEISFKDCTITNKSTVVNSYGVAFNDASPIVRIDNIKVDVNSTSGPSFYSPVLTVIYVDSNMYTNRAPHINVQNTITGSNIIVDQDIKRNTKYFR